MTDFDPIATGMARALWVQEWTSREEERGRTYPGQDLTEVAPETPNVAYFEAGRLIGMIEQANNMNIRTLFLSACKEEALQQVERESRVREAPERQDFDDRVLGLTSSSHFAEHFGSDLMLEALGHGVSWFDDHPHIPLTVPDFESSAAFSNMVEDFYAPARVCYTGKKATA